MATVGSKFVLGQGAGHKLERGINRNGGGMIDVEWLSAGENFKQVIALARGEMELVAKTPALEVASNAINVPSNTLVVVDRSAVLVYPELVKDVLHADLEATGPAQYDLAQVEQYLHKDQREGLIGGSKLYEHLCANDQELLKTCLGYADALAIQKMGVNIFRRFFQRKYLYFWKGVVRNRAGHLYIPCLYGDDGTVCLNWYRLGLNWSWYDLVVRIADLGAT